jgi:hypothetical protein
MVITSLSNYKVDISSRNGDRLILNKVINPLATVTVGDEFLSLASIQGGIAEGLIEVDSFDSLGTAPITTTELASAPGVAAIGIPVMTNAEAVSLATTADDGTLMYDATNDKLVIVAGGALETVTSA